MPAYRPARVAITGVMGPYDALLPDVTDPDPVPRARFTQETAARIAADTYTDAGDLGTQTLRVRPAGDLFEVLEWDEDGAAWTFTYSVEPGEDGHYAFDRRDFIWEEVDPGTLRDLEAALTATGLSASCGHSGLEGLELLVDLDTGGILRLTESPGATLRWMIPGLNPSGHLIWRDRDTTELTEQISQLARAPQSPFLAESFQAYVELRFQLHCQRHAARVVIEPDEEHAARVSAHLPDGHRIDLLRRPAKPGDAGWLMRDTFQRFAPGVVAPSPNPEVTHATYAAGTAARYLNHRAAR
ncbi:hypothetical protein [Streptomyces sp. 8N706]|uniref:hypothetical protein n=1 Tax=Streptomyces sp. 8N706 TaxID=3457416 RepID=UPI003FD50B29